MSGAVAPWLADLDEDWDQPSITIPVPAEPTQIVGPRNTSFGASKTRIPRRSSGAYSTDNLKSENGSIRTQRNPLAELSGSAGNALQDGSPKSTKGGARSVSMTSAGSVMRYDTIERRAQSSSPDKKATLEWKRRLVQGEVGYGDQTDLFGPSGLENIFQSPSKASPSDVKPEKPSRNRFRRQDIMPSSPPPWPSSVDVSLQSVMQEDESHLPRSLDAIGEEEVESLVNSLLASEDEDEQIQEPNSIHGDEIVEEHENAPMVPEHMHQLRQSALQKRLLEVSEVDSRVNRTVSGQTEISNESLSPVFISKHTTLTGEVGYKPMDSQTAKLLQRASVQSEEHRQSTEVHEPTSGAEGQEEETLLPEMEVEEAMEDSMPSVPEVSLPDNLPTGTPPIARLGSFVTTQRGGQSIYGSFKTRPLSPSQPESRVTSVMIRPSPLREESTSDSHEAKSKPEEDTPIPATPRANDSSKLLSPPKTRSSASPLKLFGNYDTFTNKRLLRRLSQLEDLDNGEQQGTAQSGASLQRDASREPTIHGNCSGPSQPQSPYVSRLSLFGEGELDERDFEADFSFHSDDADDDYDRSESGSPPPEVKPPGARSPFRFHVESSGQFEPPMTLKRKLSKRSTARSAATDDHGMSQFRYPCDSYQGGQQRESVHESMDFADGKRPRSSPVKAPTPKRRRTLHALDMEHDIDANQPFPSDPYQESENNDIRIGHNHEPSGRLKAGQEDADILWSGTFPRPRNPTPCQRRQSQVQEEILYATTKFLSSSPRLEAIQEQIEATELGESYNIAAQAKAVASEVAAFTLNVRKADSDGERKRSITTQDFLNEAIHIMSLIRARGRPQSGLGSVEESDEDGGYDQHLRPDDLDLARFSSSLRISRPPSREGSSNGWRPRSQTQHDSRVASQLRKFQEQGEIDIVESTIRSLHLQEVHVEYQEEQEIVERSDVDIHISGPRQEVHHQRGESGGSEGEKVDSFKTNPSIDVSTGRTLASSSTRKSENVATLAPEKVQHLIPEEVAGMTFDRTEGRWIRLKNAKSRERHEAAAHYTASNITSDDDPFGHIPDLTVDEVKEMHRIRSSLPGNGSSATHTLQGSIINQESRPVTRDHQMEHMFNSSTIPSKISAWASSRAQAETRATSWSNSELREKGQTIQDPSLLSPLEASDPFDLAYEREEDDDAEKIAEMTKTSSIDETHESTMGDSIEELPRHRSTFAQATLPRQRPMGGQTSLRRQALGNGLFADLGEQSEMSILAELPDRRLMSVSVSVSRPPAVHAHPSHEIAMQSSSPEKHSYLLSDLPDFTVNELDEVRRSEHALATKVAQHTMEAIGDRYALAVQNLVRTLTDVEPDEPFWEDLRRLDLQGKNLDCLHGLNDFCVAVQDLNVSHNSIRQLEGAPISVRSLNASFNGLSSLTAWGQLMNLQYLDVSHNELDSLLGIGSLVHLRELKADHNNITSLRGIHELDGLLKLSVASNEVTTVDFEDSKLSRLIELNLSNNQLRSVSNVSHLPSLTTMMLDDNRLTAFEFSARETAQQSKISTLSLGHNMLTTLDVTRLPLLQYLDLEGNILESILGLSMLPQLNVLSIRRQQTPRNSSNLVTSIFQQHIHVRSVYLSSNQILSLDLPHTYHSIRHLELASCGLADVPSDFGLRFPNLRSLNLNFNALKDPRPLLNIRNLEELHLAGNRMSKLRKSVATFAKMTHLRVLDVRDNTFTLGFYCPTATASIETRLVSSTGPANTGANDLEHLQRQRREADLLPTADQREDDGHLKRLDEDTGLRRRVHELLLANGCKKLEQLDGLDFDRRAAMAKDVVWERLVKLGVVQKSGTKSLGHCVDSRFAELM